MGNSRKDVRIVMKEKNGILVKKKFKSFCFKGGWIQQNCPLFISNHVVYCNSSILNFVNTLHFHQIFAFFFLLFCFKLYFTQIHLLRVSFVCMILTCHMHTLMRWWWWWWWCSFWWLVNIWLWFLFIFQNFSYIFVFAYKSVLYSHAFQLPYLKKKAAEESQNK